MIQPDEWVAQPPGNTNKTLYIYIYIDINHWICTTFDWQQKNPMKFTIRVSKKHPQKRCVFLWFFFRTDFKPTKPQPNPNRVTVPIGSETSLVCLRNAKPVDRLLEPNFTGWSGWVGLVGKKKSGKPSFKKKNVFFVIHGRIGGAIMWKWNWLEW